MRQVVLDTETTGLEPSQGHRIIEIGCVELIDRKLTGRTYHQYINPQREIDEGAIEVHGITNEFVASKPLFEAIIDEFYEFIKGSQLVIHNAPFDVGFIDNEFKLVGKQYGKVADICEVIDSLVLARNKHPGQKNNLDALCKRYEVDNSHRDLHGALLDAEILADVYLLMTGGQTALFAGSDDNSSGADQHAEAIRRITSMRQALVLKAGEDELMLHDELLESIQKSSGGQCVWKNK